MMSQKAVRTVERDERTEAVENTSYRWGYVVANFGILLAVLRRSYYLSDASWDLMAIVLASGLIVTVIQVRGRIFGRVWVRSRVLAVVIAAVVAALIAAAYLRR
ncbi:MAG: hypothetical protein Q8P31_02960 [Bacillota bacterium]|nr:hypothetical protein [Bacillota bacterium]